MESPPEPDLLDVYEDAWRRAGQPGLSPRELMGAEWSDQSEDKADFFRLERAARDAGGAAHYFTLAPVIADLDDDGRPIVTGVVHTLRRDGDRFAIAYVLIAPPVA